ncbi:glycosyltransferase family 1 protein [Luteimonas pelagia]
MRYAIVTETWPPEVNGVALTVRGFADALRRRGRVVDVVRPRQPHERLAPPADGTCLVPGCPLPRYPGLRFGLPATGHLRAHWRGAVRPDAIYVATEGPLGWSALRAAATLGIPAATGLHTRFDAYMGDYGLPWLEAPALAWMRRFHAKGNCTLVPTEELAAWLTARGFRNVRRLARAVDTARFDPKHRDPALRAAWDAPPGAPVVLHVGRIAAEKNLDLVVRAFRALQARRAGARMVWVGDGPLREVLARAHPDFVFCGVQRGPALARHLASADLFAFASRSETFGNVTLEALASGVPTVAFDRAAAREHLRDGIHGALVRDGDADAFVAAVVAIGTDDLRRDAMRIAAPRAVSHLQPSRVGAALDAILSTLSREKRHGAPAAA